MNYVFPQWKRKCLEMFYSHSSARFKKVLLPNIWVVGEIHKHGGCENKGLF